MSKTNKIPPIINKMIKAMDAEPFGADLKHALANIILKYHPNAPVKNHIIVKDDGVKIRNWN